VTTIALEALRFHYESPYAPVFHDVGLHLDTRWRTALIGRNGRGKSTLLRLLAGELEPQRGRVHVPVETRSLAPAGPGRPEPTRDVVRDSVAPFRAIERRMESLLARGDESSLDRYGAIALEYERLGGYTIEHRIDEEWAAMGLRPDLLDRPHASLSGGERTRAAIVALFLRPGGYPLIDEPTNHLDREGRERLARYLETRPGFLLASHDRAVLERCCDHVVAIERGQLRLHGGGYDDLRRQQRLEEEHESRRRERLGREIRDLEHAARARRDWSAARERTKRGAADKGYVGHRAAKLMKRALHGERRADEKLAEKRALVSIPAKRRRLALATGPGPEILLVAESLRVTVAGRTLVERLDLVVRRGDRIALVGPNGCGKTRLLDTLAGERAPARGRVTRTAGTRCCRARQVPRWRTGSLADHLRAEAIDETAFRNVLGVLGTEGDGVDRPLETWSEGERRKAELASSFLQSADLWLWDEPLDYLDVECREQIEDAVHRDRPTLLFVEHDARFVERVATRTVQLGP